MEKDEILNEGKEDLPDELTFNDDYTADDALVDDLMGNVHRAHPTPEPAYLGHQQTFHFNRIMDQMDEYRNYRNALNDKETDELTLIPADLPSDKDISLAIRAFRDKHGTKQQPVGIVTALKHVIQDMGVPLSALDQLSYSALLTCCRTEPEARRVFQLMRDNQVEVNAYCWSILVDIHAKLGDYQSCVRVHEEMKESAGLVPTLASFTSLLAACYKICNDGRVAHSIRAHANETAWEAWQEMRIIGIAADPMAYGAMLRLAAATGQPEKAINLLEEMPRFDVQPTTLCFTAALRAVARSHETAIRYEGGATPRFRRREEICAHHGKLARTILIQAEEHGAVFDTGFIAALTLCAAAAGDVATAKAIYVANQIRSQMDHLRPIGSDAHLARLRGEDVPFENTYDVASRERGPEQLAETNGGNTSDGGHSLRQLNGDDSEVVPSFGDREYGRDSRVLSAILLACARASDQNGVGTMWQGRENKGYLCINSLRLITAKWKPQYSDNEIPGQGLRDNLTWEGEHRDEPEYEPGKRSKNKFKGVDVDDSGGTTLDDLDEEFYRMFVNEDGTTKEEFRKATPEDVWLLKYGADDPYVIDGHGPHPYNLRVAERAEATANLIPQKQPLNLLEDGAAQDDDDVFFDYETKTWKKKSEASGDLDKSSELYFDDDNKKSDGTSKSIDPTFEETDNEFYFCDDEMRWKTRPRQPKAPSAIQSAAPTNEDEDKSELYFDDDEMRWKTRLATNPKNTANLTKFESEALSSPKPATENKTNTTLVGFNAVVLFCKPRLLHVTSRSVCCLLLSSFYYPTLLTGSTRGKKEIANSKSHFCHTKTSVDFRFLPHYNLTLHLSFTCSGHRKPRRRRQSVSNISAGITGRGC